MTTTKIPLYVAIAFNHRERAKEALDQMNKAYSDALKEHLDKGDIDLATIGMMEASGIERRGDGYYLIDCLSTESEEELES